MSVAEDVAPANDAQKDVAPANDAQKDVAPANDAQKDVAPVGDGDQVNKEAEPAKNEAEPANDAGDKKDVEDNNDNTAEHIDLKTKGEAKMDETPETIDLKTNAKNDKKNTAKNTDDKIKVKSDKKKKAKDDIEEEKIVPVKICTDKYKAADIQYTVKHQGSYVANTIIYSFQKAVHNHPDGHALIYEPEFVNCDKNTKFSESGNLKTWKAYTYRMYYNAVNDTARALVAQGLKPQDGVAIWGYNSTNFNIAYLAGIFAGGCSVVFSPFDRDEQLAHKIKDAGVKFIYVDDKDKIDRIQRCITKGFLNLKDCNLKAVIRWDGKSDNAAVDGVELYEARVFRGYYAQVPYWEYADIRDKQKPTRIIAFIYTNVKNGLPVASMFTHDNINWAATAFCETHQFDLKDPKFRCHKYVSHMPMDQAPELMLSIFCPILITSEILAVPHSMGVYFTRPCDPKHENALFYRIKATNPSIIYMDNLKWTAFKTWAYGQSEAFKPSLLQKCTCQGKKKLKEAFGGEDIRIALCGVNPLDSSVVEWFQYQDIEIYECHGRNETLGMFTSNTRSTTSIGTLGRGLPGYDVRVCAEKSSKALEFVASSQVTPQKNQPYEGELWVKSRAVSVGYLCNPDLGEDRKKIIKNLVKERYSKDGYFRSGENAVMDQNGFINLTAGEGFNVPFDMIKAADGTWISPQTIETKVLSAYKGIASIIVMGPPKFTRIMALVSLKTKGYDRKKPGSGIVLHKDVYADIENVLFKLDSLQKIWDDIDCEPIEEIDRAIRKHTDRYSSKHAKIARWVLLQNEFSVSGKEFKNIDGELDREFIFQKYAAHIKAMLDDVIDYRAYTEYDTKKVTAKSAKKIVLPKYAKQKYRKIKVIDEDISEDLEEKRRKAAEAKKEEERKRVELEQEKKKQQEERKKNEEALQKKMAEAQKQAEQEKKKQEETAKKAKETK